MFSVKTVHYFQFLRRSFRLPEAVAATKDLEQALESCGGDTNQAAEFLLQGKDTGLSFRELYLRIKFSFSIAMNIIYLFGSKM